MTAGKRAYALGAGVLLVFGGIVAAELVINARSGIPNDPLAAPCPPADKVGGDGLRGRNPAVWVPVTFDPAQVSFAPALARP